MCEVMDANLSNTLGLVVRFRLKPGKEQDFDQLVARTVVQIQQHEPGTLLYLCQSVDGAPDQRIFYELYQDREAFKAHEGQPYVQDFLTVARENLLEGFDVEFLTPQAQAGSLLR